MEPVLSWAANVRLVQSDGLFVLPYRVEEAKQRRLPPEVLDVLLDPLLERRTVTIGVFDCFTSELIPIANYANVKRWTPLSCIFDIYQRYAREQLGNSAPVELCYRLPNYLPNSGVWLSRESTVQSLDAVTRDNETWRSYNERRFDTFICIEAHDAHRATSHPRFLLPPSGGHGDN